MRQLQKFSLRKSYALALTKKKEILYWGDLLEQPKSESQQVNICLPLFLKFINTLTAASEDNNEMENEYGFGVEEPASKQTSLLSKRIAAFKSIKIMDIACNDFVAHFLAEDGRLYSVGRDIKKYGLLGLGATYEVQHTPVLNSSLVDFRISKITVGLSHCCALTSSGQLYSWGTGQNGQLCQPDDTMFSNVPKQVLNSKQIGIKEVICSSYYTLILSTQGKLTMFGTLKGFAKFLFDSPTKDLTSKQPDSFSNSRLSERISNRQKLDLGDSQQVTSVCIAERSFACYCAETQNLYFVGESFEPELVMQREMKSFQFLNGQKYIVAHDTNNILMILTQRPLSPQSSFTLSNQQASLNIMNETTKEKHSWQIIKEFNLIQRFNTADVELLAQDTQIGTKKAQNMQMLMFITQSSYSKQLMNTFNKKYYKTFLTGNQQQQLQQNGYETENSTISDSQWFANKAMKPRQCQSPYASFGSSIYEGGTSRHRLKMKIDTMFGSTFSARKNGRNSSTSLKERAKKLHQSLSPVQRFPIINNLCEIIKQQKLQRGSPSKADHPFINLQNLNSNITDQMKSPQYNLFLKSLNLACQITNMGTSTESQLQSAKQLQFLSKAEKIRQDLNKNQALNMSKQTASTQQIEGCRQVLQQNSMCNQGEASQDKSSELQDEEMKDHFNMPLQISTAKQQQIHNLSCIMEDGENSTVMQSNRKMMGDNSKQTKTAPKVNKRQGSVNIPDYPHKLLDYQVKRKTQIPNEILNIDTISEITLNGRESMHRFSQGGSEFTNNNINSYKILIMNTRAVIEKKLLQCLMMGFMSIKYYQGSGNNASSFQSFQLQTTFNQSQHQIDATHICSVDKAALLLQKLVQTHEKFEFFTNLKKMISDSKNKHKSIKKLVSLLKQKQEQNLTESIRKIQISVRYMKLQRLNTNLLLNSLSKIQKKSLRQEMKNCFIKISQYSIEKLQTQFLDKINKTIQSKIAKKILIKWREGTDYRMKYYKGLRKIHKALKNIDKRQCFTRKINAIKQFKANVECFNQNRNEMLSSIMKKIQQKHGFQSWVNIINEKKLFEELQRQLQKQEKVLQIETRTLQELKFEKNTPIKKVMCEKSIQGEDSMQSDLDIEESQLEPVISPKQQQQTNKQFLKKEKPTLQQQQQQHLELQRLMMKGEISFDKNELGEHFLSLDGGNMTAHFNKFGLLMSNHGKENQITDFTEGLIPRPNYHHHLTQDDAPETFTLEPQFNTRNSISIGAHSRQQSINTQHTGKTPKNNTLKDKSSNKENLSIQSKLKLSIQNEISPTNNCKNYQRQTQINKQYEQAEPFELPINDNDLPVYTQSMPDNYAKFIDKYFDPVSIPQQQQSNPQQRYSFKNVVPFNPTEDTPMDFQLRQQLNAQKSKDMPMPQHVFESKKQSNASSQASNAQQKAGFINNYFKQLSAQNSAARSDNHMTQPVQEQNNIAHQQKAVQNQQYQLQEQQQQQQQLFQKQQIQQQPISQNQLNYLHQQSTSTHSQLKQPNSSASFVTNNQNIDLMHFNSHSDNSFVFFDDNFWRDSGISSVSRVISPNSQKRQANHSFGQQQANPIFMSNLLKQAYLQKRQQEHMPH